jgi:hypothetical protein
MANEQNPFDKLKKTTRGKGLGTPPKKPGNNTALAEHTPAAPVSQPRSYRISTMINENAGDQLEQAIIRIRKETGKKPKIAEVLEIAISKL